MNIDVLLTWGTTRVRGVRVRHDTRVDGRSNYTFWSLLRHSLNMLTGFSVLPLQLASFAGFCLTILGIALLAFVLGRYFMQGVAVPGFAFLASITIIFAGAQLATLGIMGEYLARMHFRLMERPSYTVRTTSVTGSGSDSRNRHPMAYRIPFNRPTRTDRDLTNVQQALRTANYQVTARSPSIAIRSSKRRSGCPRCCSRRPARMPLRWRHSCSTSSPATK